jgi:hypothetical protein
MSDYFEREKREKSKEPHPVWRGIGFIMMILIPILSFAMADVLLQLAKNNGINVPLEFQSAPIPIPIYGPVANLKAVLILAFAIMLVLFGLFTIINSAVYRGSKDSTYQIFQAQPKQYKRKRKLKKPTYEK